SLARSRTFFGNLAFATSALRPEIRPAAPRTRSAASRNDSTGARRPRSTEDTCSSLYPICAPRPACVRPSRSRHILMIRPTVRRTAADSSSAPYGSTLMSPHLRLPPRVQPAAGAARHAGRPGQARTGSWGVRTKPGARVRLLSVAAEEPPDPADRRFQVVGVGEGEDAEVVGGGPVAAGALDHLDLLPQEQVQDELLVVVEPVRLGVQAGEGVHRALGLHAAHAGDLVELLPGHVPLLAQPAAGCGEVTDGLPAAERGLDRVLRGGVGAQAHGGQHGEALQVVLGVLLGAGD